MDTVLSFLQTEYIRKLDCRLRFLLDKFSIEEIVKEIALWLRDKNLDYFDTTTFARDFYISSDLTKEEKNKFYSELKKQGFFELLNEFLTSQNFSVCSWTIYTIGKFSDNKNAIFLERAYKKDFSLRNPILSYRCLNEMNWLNSKMTSQFLSDLETNGSKVSKLILLYYWETNNDDSKYNELLTDEELLTFISPNQSLIDKKDEISDRLFDFEVYISDLYNRKKRSDIDLIKFEQLAKDFFQNYYKTLDNKAGKNIKAF